MDAEFLMTIDGRAVPGSSQMDVVDPATERVVAQAPVASGHDLDAAVLAANRATRTWGIDDDARRELLLAAATRVFEEVDTLAPLITAEQGKPLVESRAEVQSLGVWLKYYARLDAPSVELLEDNERRHLELEHRPYGVVGAITPWNAPLGSASWKIAPALRAGNTVVLKPSPFTPLSSLAMGQILAEVLPPGVLNVVTGGDDLGKLLVQHPGVQKLGFTGSVESGRHVALAAAARNLDVTLELGGNDPAILLEDIDLETAATKLFWGAFGNAGQLCAAIKRVYAPRSRYDEVVTALAAKARSVKVGAGNVEGVKLGPLCNRPQFDRVRELVDDALASGGVAVEGGEALDGPGFFFPPTIVADARDGMRLVDEEQFGPALPFVPYDDLDEVIATVNSSRFGLGSSVWSADADRAWAVGHEIDAGMVWLNAHGVVSPRLPFGGIRDSGHGLENGLVGLREYTQARVRQRR